MRSEREGEGRRKCSYLIINVTSLAKRGRHDVDPKQALQTETFSRCQHVKLAKRSSTSLCETLLRLPRLYHAERVCFHWQPRPWEEAVAFLRKRWSQKPYSCRLLNKITEHYWRYSSNLFKVPVMNKIERVRLISLTNQTGKKTWALFLCFSRGKPHGVLSFPWFTFIEGELVGRSRKVPQEKV